MAFAHVFPASVTNDLTLHRRSSRPASSGRNFAVLTGVLLLCSASVAFGRATERQRNYQVGTGTVTARWHNAAVLARLERRVARDHHHYYGRVATIAKSGE